MVSVQMIQLLGISYCAVNDSHVLELQQPTRSDSSTDNQLRAVNGCGQLLCDRVRQLMVDMSRAIIIDKSIEYADRASREYGLSQELERKR